MTTLTLESIVHRSITMHPTLLAERLESIARTLSQAESVCEPGATRRGLAAQRKAVIDSAAWLRDACGSDAFAAIVAKPERLRAVARAAAPLLCYTPAILNAAIQEYEARETSTLGALEAESEDGFRNA